jgi:hypothetical protein
MKKYIGLVVFYIGLAMLVTFGARAHAEPNPVCLEFAAENVPDLHAAFVKHIDPSILRYLILTDKGIGERGRGLLLREIAAMEGAEAAGKRMSQSEALAYAAFMCNEDEPSPIPPLRRPQWAHPPEEI